MMMIVSETLFHQLTDEDSSFRWRTSLLESNVRYSVILKTTTPTTMMMMIT
jgi:hypothetical protein